MKLYFYSVFDSKARAFIPPFTMPNDETALRMFGASANDPSHAFCKFGSDFTLFRVGSFDDATGDVSFESPHVNLGLAASLRVVDFQTSSELGGE